MNFCVTGGVFTTKSKREKGFRSLWKKQIDSGEFVVILQAGEIPICRRSRLPLMARSWRRRYTYFSNRRHQLSLE